MKQKLLAIFLILFFTIVGNAQDILWEKSYGGKHADYLLEAIPTPENGFVVAGSTISSKTGSLTQETKGNLDYWVCKLDANGEILWQKTFGGKGLDLLQSVKLTPDGGMVLAGISNSEAKFDKLDECKGDTDYWIIKLDSHGAEQWQSTIGGAGQEKLRSIALTADGGYIIGGSSGSNKSELIEGSNEVDPFGKTENSRGNLDYWVVKLTATGNVAWQKTYGGKYLDELKSVVPVPTGGYLLGGYSNSPKSGDKTDDNIGIGDYWVIKIDNIGTLIWQKTIGGNLDDDLFVLTPTQDGNFILAGNSNSSSSNSKSKANGSGTDYWVVKMDTEGGISWQETYNFGKSDILNSVVENPDGTLLLGGFAQSEAKTNNGNDLGKLLGGSSDKKGINDYVALKVSPNGEALWSKSVGSKEADVLEKLLPTPDGGYLLAGTSSGNKSRDKSASKGGKDFWVVKVKDLVKPEKPEYSIAAYPNPAVNNTSIGVSFAYDYGTATLYDLNGRQLQQKEIKGEQSIPFNLTDLPSGIYLVKIKTNVQSDGIKIIKSQNK